MKRSFYKKTSILQSDSNRIYLSKSLEVNMSNISEILGNSDDLVLQSVQLGKKSGYFIYLQELVNGQTLNDIKKELFVYIGQSGKDSAESLQLFIQNSFSMSQVNQDNCMNKVIEQILSGYTVLLIDDWDHAFLFKAINEKGRAVQEPDTEQLVRGPREGFVENIETNLRLIRRKIRNPALKVKYLRVGEQTRTMISVAYIQGIADEKVVEEVQRRLSQIEIDAVLESHYLESMIADMRWSPFPTVYSTERPDRVAAALLDGKVAILTDGTPFVLTAPAVFVEFLHSNEDYYNGSLIATLTRWIRFLGLFITLILPAFYVAITTFHQDLLQTSLLLRIAAGREDLPYPIVVEALFMVITFELVREAGLRMPKTFGGAVITILGMVLISQIAVQAGIIGPIMTIVVSVTSIVSFILPNYAFHQVVRFFSVPILILAGLFGFMGILIGLMFGLTHLVSLRSFGVPYFSPVSPARREGWKDVFIRAPWWAMETRPPGLDIENIRRAGENEAPPRIKNKGGNTNEET